MTTNSDPESHIWSSDTVCDIITTSTKMLDCRARGNFHAMIHKDLLCYFSTYYASLVDDGFAEAGLNNVKFELDEPSAKMLVTWLYSGYISKDARYPDIFDLYLFADMKDMRGLRKTVMDHLHKNSTRNGNPELKDVAKVCATLSMSSGLVRWMVDRYNLHWRQYNLEEPMYADAVEKHKDFFEQVEGAHANEFKHICRNTCCMSLGHPCCNVPVSVNCDCPAELHERGRPQSCRYHEHATIEEWQICSGENFHVADKAYLRDTTAAAPKMDKRFAILDRHRYRRDGETVWSYRDILS